MSLIDDIDDLMWPVFVKFDKALVPDEWYELDCWCNQQFGKDGWWLEKGVMRLRKEEHATIFLLRWG
jgi:hypothetical protein